MFNYALRMPTRASGLSRCSGQASTSDRWCGVGRKVGCFTQNSRRAPRVQTFAAQQDAVSISELSAVRKSITSAIELAVKREDYSTAAKLKKDLERINAQDPIYTLNEELQRCIKEERFKDAAIYQEKLKALEAQFGPQMVKTSSDTVTDGIRVKVQSFFRPVESAPHLNQYFFGYRITIVNESDRIVQLRNRHWVIVDETGHKEEVRGPGVVGEQPILLPGKSFEYTSNCPLRTPSGTMEGEFGMVVLSEEDGEFRESFEARVGKFKLSMSKEE